MAGDTTSALALEHGFQGPPASDEFYYLALPHDPERSRRYKLIGKFIDRNDGRNPKVPDIDQIVPLPPAKLPPWDGTFQWQKEQDAAVPPQQPAEELVNRLSQARNLDPATGLPIPPPPKKPLGTRADTGERCPEGGVWCVPEVRAVIPMATRHFRKGEILPPLVVRHSRWRPLLDSLLGERYVDWQVTWKLIGYEEQA